MLEDLLVTIRDIPDRLDAVVESDPPVYLSKMIDIGDFIITQTLSVNDDFEKEEDILLYSKKDDTLYRPLESMKKIPEEVIRSFYSSLAKAYLSR